MSGHVYDNNLIINDNVSENTVNWYEVSSDMFNIYGVLPEIDGIITRRMPLEIAKTVSQKVSGLCGYGAGGRVVFFTDSPFIALKIEHAKGAVQTVCNHCFAYGFDIYKFDGNEKDVFPKVKLH